MKNNTYPVQHMFITTDLRKAALPDDISSRQDIERFVRRRFKRAKHGLINQLVRHNMLNMKTINKALGAKSETERKKFAKTLLPNVNDYKRETHAFAYVGDGMFVHAVAKQHDEDFFIKKTGRQRALGILDSKLDNVESWMVPIEWLITADVIPEKVAVEMKRMMDKEEPDLVIAPVEVLGDITDKIEDEDFSIPDREDLVPVRETSMYAGSMYDGRTMIN